jgi:hypothetical protein
MVRPMMPSMLRTSVLVGGLSAALLAPLAVLGQPAGNDLAYCGQLYGMARRYVSGVCSECRPDLNIEGAWLDCQKGDTARGTAYLERRLRASGITLPPRS